MLSRSFYRAQPDYLQLEKAGTIRQGSYGTYGAWVVWEIPSVMGSMSMHSERYYFFVNDLPGPLCTKKPAGYECKMQIYIDRDIQDLQGQVAASIFGSMTGTNYDPDAFTKKTKTNYDGRTFEWTDITLTVTGQASGWRSTVVDQFMTEFARKEEAQRLAAARARNATPPPDPNRQLCNSIAAGAVASMNFSATNSLSYQMMC